MDCWGFGIGGQLGDGIFYTLSTIGSASPVQVVGVGGTGTLSAVAALAGEGGGIGEDSTYCALLTSGGVDCWGEGGAGELGNGMPSITATAVQVVAS